MSFAAGNVLRLTRVPPGVYTMLVGRDVVVNRVEVGQNGIETYFVSMLVPLSAADNAALGRAPGPPAPLELELMVRAGQLQAIEGGAVWADISAVRDGGDESE